MFTHLQLQPLQDLNTHYIDGKRYYLLPSGNAVPSVTSMLSHFSKDGIEEWKKRVGLEEAEKIKNRAATRGTRLHSLVENYLNNKPEKEILRELMPNIRQSFFDIKPVLDRINNIHFIEGALYSEKIELAGRADLCAEFDSELSIIDFKTSSRNKQERWIQDYFIQATAYATMYEELSGFKPTQIVIIIAVDGEPEPQVFVRNPKNYYKMLHQKMNDYKKDIDRQRSL